MSKYQTGTYQIVNRNKYVGPKNPKYRSSWERRLCYFLDQNRNVKRWGYEIITIPYYYSIDHKMHKYIVDFYVELVDADNKLQKYLVEVKPKCQTMAPKVPKRKTRKTKSRYLNETKTYIRNVEKWQAAEKFCKQHGIIWRIITETTLF